MELTINDWIGFAGVAILLIAFLLNLTGKLSKDGLIYILLNIIGAGLACLASWLINYIPFVILEASWTLVSLWALINYFTNKHPLSP
jgi:hypothetical protein